MKQCRDSRCQDRLTSNTDKNHYKYNISGGSPGLHHKKKRINYNSPTDQRECLADAEGLNYIKSQTLFMFLSFLPIVCGF